MMYQIGNAISHLTLDRYAEKSHNSFGVVRLLAALAVIFTHSFGVVGGWDVPEPLAAATGMSLGAHAVHVFFTLSGFMVAASFERSSSWVDFVLARILRVMPALFVVNVCIVVLGGLFLTTAAAADYWTLDNVGTFFAKTILMFSVGTPLLGVFSENPVPGAINIPIWTIRFEVIAYATLLVLFMAMEAMRLKGLARLGPVLAILAVSAAVLCWSPESEAFTFLDQLSRFTFAFYLGVAAWIMRAELMINLPTLLVLSAFAALAVEVESMLRYALMITAVGYGSFWLGSFQMGWVQRRTAVTDLSYGVYISGFFIQQWIAASMPWMDAYTNAAVACAIAMLVAWFSWTIVERPAIRLRRRPGLSPVVFSRELQSRRTEKVST